ncbi:RES domain-containing protein [Flavobacterium hibernum]|uniref:RES domain-containing protein n=1 Tax=Flavobacterium hibernum TaxID=37752 RepID=A0A0D0EDP1_9FLAO|nr:RES domain-containing protein [Flavobacterium hibernum]KIO50944.1 hypothetical protein IW18_20355 [Flavobacterium hibernum]OXA85184.1 hypothetical protein B0A73_17695 [Flavobacterium hibernum]STO19560.1 Uncharacterised protein [Flavobacterium hibernum]
MKFNFPKQPDCRNYKTKLSEEQQILMKISTNQIITVEEEEILKVCIEYYKEAFAYLKSINLSEIEEGDLAELIRFIKSVFYMELITQRKLYFNYLYRVTTVIDIFLEDGKVRDLGFIKNPPLEVNKKNGVYNRANTPDSTIFYCAFIPSVAILEVKPKVGQRIIIAEWYKEDKHDFIAYLLTNDKTVDNEGLKLSTTSFQQKMENQNPYFAEILGLHLEFLSSEFLKIIPVNSEKKYEYLFSAYFADIILKNDFEPLPDIEEPIAHYDGILYPSIAVKHESENLAIIPQSIKKLMPLKLIEGIVLETFYDNPKLDESPISVNVLRTATKFDDERIYWDDDEISNI